MITKRHGEKQSDEAIQGGRYRQRTFTFWTL